MQPARKSEPMYFNLCVFLFIQNPTIWIRPIVMAGLSKRNLMKYLVIYAIIVK